MEKNATLIALGVVVLVTILGASVYFLKGNEKESYDSSVALPTISGIASSDWRTYLSKEHRFELKYPQGFDAKAGESSSSDSDGQEVEVLRLSYLRRVSLQGLTLKKPVYRS